MSMTREEAIELFGKILAGAKQGLEEHPEEGKRVYGMRKELAEMALTALRPVSREQVEKVWRGEWVEYPRPYYYKCSKCKYTVPHKKAALINGKRAYNYCPACGSPMTDEAVQMVMERLEAMSREDN